MMMMVVTDDAAAVARPVHGGVAQRMPVIVVRLFAVNLFYRLTRSDLSKRKSEVRRGEPGR